MRSYHANKVDRYRRFCRLRLDRRSRWQLKSKQWDRQIHQMNGKKSHQPKESDSCHCRCVCKGKPEQNFTMTRLTKFSKIACLALLVGLDCTASLFSQPAADTRASTGIAVQLPELLPREKEIDLALSAAPEHLRKGAAVYVLERAGFVKVRESTNGFTCIVNRDHPLSQKPVCFDAEGTATILPKILRVGELLMRGQSMSEIDAEIAEGFRTGKYVSPRRAGVAYMLSGDIRNFNPRTGKVESFPPHVMFYAPNLTNADLGTTPEALAKDPSLPFVAYQGPHGFIIMLANSEKQTLVTH